MLSLLLSLLLSHFHVGNILLVVLKFCWTNATLTTLCIVII